MNDMKIYVVWLYAIMAFLFFGGMVSTMITQYPNWDHNLPDSLVTTAAFYTMANPGTFFQLFGKINVPLFIVMMIMIWKMKTSRNFFLIHFATFFIIGLGTGLLVYPILNELFADNLTSRPIQEIQGLLDNFKMLDFIRSIIGLISIIFLALGMIKFHEEYYSAK